MSVITIFYNGADYLAEAIDSVLAQDFSDFELLLVDDGSTDASTEIAGAYAANDPTRVRLLHHPHRQNRGMSASRNRGLGEARGDLIAFIDADDRWRANKLREQVAIVDRHPNVHAVCGAVNYWRSWEGGRDRLIATGHVQNRAVEPAKPSLMLYPLGKAHAPCPSDLMIRRSAIRDVGGFEESFTGPLQMYEDQAFLAKFYLRNTVYFSDSRWTDYRLHDRSCSAEVTRQGRYHDVRRHFLEWFEQYLAEHPDVQTKPVLAALKRALRPYRYPKLAFPLRLAGKIMG